jgi:hypothetical protein
LRRKHEPVHKAETEELMGKQKVTAQPLEVLHQLAKDIVHGHIFTHRHLEDVKLVIHVFLPIGLGGLDDIDYSSLGMIYARRDSAIRLSINGHPVFRECSLLNKKDAKAVWKMANEMHEAVERVQIPAKKKVTGRRRQVFKRKRRS